MRGMEGFAIAEDQYETSLDIFVDDLRNILNHLGIDDVAYAGESFGGVSGLNFAHKYPHWTRVLALCNTPCRLPRRERSGRGGDWDAAPSQSVGAWSAAAIDNRLDIRAPPQELKECHIAEMDRTSSSIGRSLQGYRDALDFSTYLPLLEGGRNPDAAFGGRGIAHLDPGAAAVYG